MKKYFVCLLFLSVLSGCQDHPGNTNSREAMEAAQEVYKYRCSMCHGSDGQGNGPTAKALPTKPPNWTNPNWQSAVTDQGIRNAITGGGMNIGRSQVMPPHEDLEGTKELNGLVELIRAFGR